MKPFKTLFMLLTAVMLLTVTSACEEEWSNLSDDQKLIELLLQPTPRAEDFNLDPDHRFVILKTGLDPDSVCKDPYLQAQTQFTYLAWARIVDDSIIGPPDTVAFVQDVTTLRQNLTVTPDRKVWLNDFEVIGIEDVRGHWKSGSASENRFHFHTYYNELSVYLYSQEDIPDFIRYIESLGCRVHGTHYWDFLEAYSVYISLPLGRKALSTSEYIRSNYKVKDCWVIIDPAGDFCF